MNRLTASLTSEVQSYNKFGVLLAKAPLISIGDMGISPNGMYLTVFEHDPNNLKEDLMKVIAVETGNILAVFKSFPSHFDNLWLVPIDAIWSPSSSELYIQMAFSDEYGGDSKLE